MTEPTKSKEETQAQEKSKLNFRQVSPVFFLVLVDVLGLTVILPLLHLYGAVYGATALQIGLVAAAFPLAQLIGVPLMGALSDRFGRKPLLLISQITTFASFIMLGLAGSLEMVILSRMIDGLFGANLSTAQAALTDMTDDDTRTQGLGLIGAAFGIGFVLGPIIAIVSLSLSDSLAIPAFIAAAYSFVSILLTLFIFTETLPPEKRGTPGSGRGFSPAVVLRMLRLPQVNLLLVLMFAQQLVFFGFEALLGLFTLSRLGLLGQGNGLIFLFVGVILVVVQGRYIGIWSRKYGDARLVYGALGLLSIGLILMALTPEQPHPFYVERIVQNELRNQAPNSTQAMMGEIRVELPDERNRGFGGVIWVLFAIIPISIGSGLIRPSLNSLITKRVAPHEYGTILGVSAAFISAANAAAPLIGGLLFQSIGATATLLAAGGIMGILALVSMRVVRPAPAKAIA